MIETQEHYDRLYKMAEEDRINILDPICQAIRGKVFIEDGIEVLANRIFALIVLDLYQEWQKELYERG